MQRPKETASAPIGSTRKRWGLWRGDFLWDIAHRDFVRDEAARYTELRLAAIEEWSGIRLERGRHQELIPELEAAVRAHPLREEMRRLLALALYRAGRQADALASIGAARQLLADELGIDPGPPLRQLEVQILQQSPDLDWRPSHTAPSAPQATARSVVGRDREVAVVKEAWDATAAGRASRFGSRLSSS